LLLPLLFALGCSSKPDTLTAGGHPVAYWLDEAKKPDPKARRKAVRELGHVGKADPAALPAVTEALKDRDVEVRREAALALLNLGADAKEAEPALVEAGKDGDKTVREYAAKALERIRGGP
jgi:HEAT repeat protein